MTEMNNNKEKRGKGKDVEGSAVFNSPSRKWNYVTKRCTQEQNRAEVESRRIIQILKERKSVFVETA